MKGRPSSPPESQKDGNPQGDQIVVGKKVKVRDSAYRQARHEARRLAREKKEWEKNLLEKSGESTKKSDKKTPDSSASFTSQGQTLLHSLETIRDKNGKKPIKTSPSSLSPPSLSLSLSSSFSPSSSVSGCGDLLSREHAGGYEGRGGENLEKEKEKKREQRNGDIHGGEITEGTAEQEEAEQGKRKRKRKRKRKSSGLAVNTTERTNEMNGELQAEEEEEEREGGEREREDGERQHKEKKKKGRDDGVSTEERVGDHGERRANADDTHEIAKKKQRTEDNVLERCKEKEVSFDSSSSSYVKRETGEDDGEEEKEDRPAISPGENKERKAREKDQDDDGVGLDDIAKLLKHGVSSSSPAALSLAGDKNRGRPDFTRRYCVVEPQDQREDEKEQRHHTKETPEERDDDGGDLDGGEIAPQQKEEQEKKEKKNVREEDQDEVLQSLHPCLVDRLRRTMNIHSLFPGK